MLWLSQQKVVSSINEFVPVDLTIDTLKTDLIKKKGGLEN